MKRLMQGLLMCVALLAGHAQASEWGLSARVVHERVQTEGERILFIDVRDPVEIMFVGSATGVDVNLPYRLVDRTRWDEKNGRFMMPLNEELPAQVRAALEAKGLDERATIITMCRSGSERGEPSAAYLREQGFPNVFFVEHGFQGDARREGEQVGMRTLNGWQNEGLPWSPRLDPERVYRP